MSHAFEFKSLSFEISSQANCCGTHLKYCCELGMFNILNYRVKMKILKITLAKIYFFFHKDVINIENNDVKTKLK